MWCFINLQASQSEIQACFILFCGYFCGRQPNRHTSKLFRLLGTPYSELRLIKFLLSVELYFLLLFFFLFYSKIILSLVIDMY